MTDLIKREDALAAIYEDSPEWTREAIAALPAIDPAATREAALQALIEELMEQSSRRLALARSEGCARIDQFERAEALEAKLTECEARLGKAVEALRNTLDKPRDADQSYAGLCSEVMWEIRATLAELEGK